jgi:hypothetical protein
MANLADLETAYLVPCKHCAKPMHEWDLFCPSCDKDQTLAAGDAAADAGFRRSISGADEALATIALEPGALLQQKNPSERLSHPFPTQSANEEAEEFGFGRIRPGAAVARQQVPERSVQAQWAGSTANRWVIAVTAALVLVLVIAVVYDHVYPDGQPEAVKLREIRANVEDVPEAPLPPQAMAATPAPETGVAVAKDQACSEALAALALCSTR